MAKAMAGVGGDGFHSSNGGLGGLPWKAAGCLLLSFCPVEGIHVQGDEFAEFAGLEMA